MSKKKTNPNKVLREALKKEVIDVFLSKGGQKLNYKQLSKQLGVTDKKEKLLVQDILDQLVNDKKLLEANRGKYELNQQSSIIPLIGHSYITGVVDMTPSGKAYVISSEVEEDVRITSNNTNRALHGDTVKVFLFPKRKDRKLEGQIIEVITRSQSRFVGTMQISKQYAFLIPDKISMPVDIFIPLNELNGATQGIKAVAEIVDWPERAKNPFGKIIKVLGASGTNEVEIQSIMVDFNLPLSFDQASLKIAESINKNIDEKDIRARRDFRKVTTFTIDPPDAKDFDDAVSLKKLQNGNWEVGVHIADVAHYIKEGNALDKEAYERATSVYLVDRVILMLPERLSNDICSLKPKEDKLCFSAVFEMSDDGKILNRWFGKSIINSDKRFNYDEVQLIIETQKGEFVNEILLLDKLAKKLREQRFRKGSIAFETVEVKFILDDKGKPIDVYIKESKDAHKLIEDFMLLANREVATLIGKTNKGEAERPFLYRVHDEPSQEKLHTFSDFVRKFGYKIQTDNRKSVINSLNNVLKDVNGKGEENLISTLAIRTMQKAVYSHENIGHYGLAFDYYTHFTSPIRRYPDLVVHRLLDTYLQKKYPPKSLDLESIGKHTSEREKVASEAERASIKYKQVEFLSDKIGKIFNGIISGVSKWGIFVEIEGNKCEGMVQLKDIEEDFYYLDEENYCVVGQRYGRKYQLGDKVRIKVKKADLLKKQLDFLFIEDE
ncbi:MAG: ribonuclease R [Bacteroidales bacterium]|nr:ribonuclease R [Bacteroidales bacterium]